MLERTGAVGRSENHKAQGEGHQQLSLRLLLQERAWEVEEGGRVEGEDLALQLLPTHCWLLAPGLAPHPLQASFISFPLDMAPLDMRDAGMARPLLLITA